MHNSKSKPLRKAGSGCGPRNSNETEGGQPRGKLLMIKWEYLLCPHLKWNLTVKGRDSCSSLVSNMVCQHKSCHSSPSQSKPGQLHSRTGLFLLYQTKELLIQSNLYKGRVHLSILRAMHKPVFPKLVTSFLKGPRSSRLLSGAYVK